MLLKKLQEKDLNECKFPMNEVTHLITTCNILRKKNKQSEFSIPVK